MANGKFIRFQSCSIFLLCNSFNFVISDFLSHPLLLALGPRSISDTRSHNSLLIHLARRDPKPLFLLFTTVSRAHIFGLEMITV